MKPKKGDGSSYKTKFYQEKSIWNTDRFYFPKREKKFNVVDPFDKEEIHRIKLRA